ncbi:MAG: kinase [Novosphingobium meiothermophilum]|uniref:kinase n=1 Tax=Novosphingobium TaxID=165696 RepID=UPI000D6DF9AA|nr:MULTISPECIES: kinase [Novosphingobium]
MTSTAAIVAEHLLPRLKDAVRRPFVLGLCGAQGSGKTWTTRSLRHLLEAKGIRVAAFSLDDLYLARARREALARAVHPLLAVRGVPGTHDVELGLALFGALGQSGRVQVPAFDKACDDLFPREAWPFADAPVDVVLFEGWCVGAVPQDEAALASPVNRLEREDDPDMIWRRHVNACLAGPYAALFARIDMLVLLAAPGFGVVSRWRRQQEETLRRSITQKGGEAPALMDRAAIERFVMFYERLTRHILAEMPSRADLTIALDVHRNPVSVRTA